MRLDSATREFVRWEGAVLPEGTTTVYLRFDTGGIEGEWFAAEVVDGVPRVLVAGPDADPGTAVVLPAGRTLVKARLEDNPEAPVRNGGVIDIVPRA